MSAFNEGLLDYMHTNSTQLLEEIDPDQKLSEAVRSKILSVAEEYINCSVGGDSGQQVETEA